MSQAPGTTDSTNFNRLERRLMRESGSAIQDFNMIEDGDKIMVCLSGGKDSYTMLELLTQHQRRAPISFELIAMNLDQKQPGFPDHILPAYLEKLGVKYHIETEDTYSVVVDKIPEGKTMCSLCSRLRRGIIYRVAKELGINKIALGHHRDDILETFFLNFFHGGRLKAMPPKLLSDNKENVIIRPLAYCQEEDIARYSRAKKHPIIPCNLCGSQLNLQRKVVKSMLADWEKIQPGRSGIMFRALQNTSPSHLLDKDLFDFKGLSQVQELQELDTVFDPQ